MCKKLDWPDIWGHEILSRDSAGRWNIGDKTPASVRKYLYNYRAPSRAWPNSYARALLTNKFARYLVDHDQELAKKIGIMD